MSLEDFGWTAFLSAPFERLDGPGRVPGRVILANRGFYLVQAAQAELRCRVSGRQLHESVMETGRRPVVGDWVVCRADRGGSGLITDILPRRTRLSRRLPGERTAEQTLAANIDTVLLVMGLDGDFNLRRMDRLLTLVYEGGAEPVVVLNKADCVDDVEERRLAVQSRAAGGALLIDAPGIREVGLWGTEEGLGETFDDVLALAECCRFRDCRHESEPGCAVRDAIRDGLFSEERLGSYRKLQKELQYLDIRADEGAQRVQKRKWRAIHKAMRKEAKLLRPRKNETDLL